MKIRKALGFASAAALGAAAVVLPAAASSETAPAVKAENLGEYSHRWTPPTVSVGPSGAVEFSNPTGVPHGIHWISTPGATPSCDAAVPVGTEVKDAGTNWHGSCTFATAGTYVFYCTVHGSAMSGQVTVSAAGTTGTTPAEGGTTGTPTTGTSSPPPAGGQSGAGGPAGAQLLAPKVAAPKGGTVHGSYTLAQSAAGGTVTVTLSAKLGGRRVQVGRLTRSYLSPGLQRWSIALSSRARRALRAKRRLVVTVRIALTPPGGAPSVLTRTVTVRA